MKKSRCLLVGLVPLMLSCATLPAAEQKPRTSNDEEPAGLGETGVRSSLRRAEVAFARAAAERDAEHFRSFLDDDAIFAGGRQPLYGADAILEAWAAFFTEDGPSIKWEPESVEVLPDGLLGMTRGPYTVRQKDADGGERTSGGTYFSVWRRGAVDEPWRVVLDNGVSDP